MKTIFEIETEEEYLQHKDTIHINQLTTAGNNALYNASFEKAQWLIKHGCDIHKKNMHQQNALFSQSIDCKTLNFLIDSGIETDLRDSGGKTPLFYMQQVIDRSIEESFERIDILVKAGVNVNARDNDGQNILFSLNTYPDIVAKLIEYGINVNCIDNFNKNALFFASEDVARILCKNNIDVHVIDENGSNALFYSNTSIIEDSFLDDTKGIHFLVQNTNIDPFLCNKRGEIALSNLPNESLSFLIAKGVMEENIIINSQQENLFFQSQRVDIFEQLLESGTDINHKNHKGETAIFWNSLEMIKKLLDSGIDINSTNQLGNNALYRFILKGFRNEEDEKIAELLIISGIDYKIYPSIPTNLKKFVAEAEKNELDKLIDITHKSKTTPRI